MTSRMEQLVADLPALLGCYGYEPEKHYFNSVGVSLARAKVSLRR